MSTSIPPKGYKKQWTGEEDEELLELVKIHGVCGSW